MPRENALKNFPKKESYRSSSIMWSVAALWGVSGFSILTLEMVWMRQLALWIGNTAVAATLVMVVFFSSASLGNFFGARLVTRQERPLGLYWRFEMAAALAAVLTFMVGKLLWSGATLPEGWLGALYASLLLVGLSSFLSGVSFPSLAETFVPSPNQRTSCGGIFYAMNLLGAAAGVVVGGIFLPWWLGLRGAFAFAACVQFCGALLALKFAGVVPARAQANRNGAHSNWTGARLAFGWALVIGSGVLSMSAQCLLIFWTRQVLGGSIYSVCGVLAAFITGLGLGAMASAFGRRRGISAGGLLTGFACLSSLWLFLIPILGGFLSVRAIQLTGDNPAQMTAQAVGWCMVTLLPGAFCLGGVFPIAWELVQERFGSEGKALGLALGLNKLGCAAGAAMGTFLLMPALGLRRGTEVIAWGYALAALLGALSARQRRLAFWAGFALLIGLGLVRATRPSQELGITSTLRLIASYSGAYGPVSVVEDTVTGAHKILLNSRQRLSGTRKGLASQRHQSWVPLLFCREPERVVTIGMATGISATAALDYPIKELFSVELVPEVVQAAREHFREWNAPLFDDPRSIILVGDGRAVLGQLEGQFDAIVCDLFFPDEEGSALLYSREFFLSAKARLSPGGVFCLWLPCYQHTADSAGMIIRTFMDAFPHAVMVRANFNPLAPVLGLLGSVQPIPFSRDFFTAQLASPAGKLLATRSPFFGSPDNAMLLLVCDLYSADPGFGMFPTTTDDHPLFAYLGPREPRGTERLIGFSFLNWIGKRSLRPFYPSCDLAEMPPEQLLKSVRAGNFYFAAAAADVSLPGDKRPARVRLEQVRSYSQRARELNPNARLSFEAFGQ